MCIVLVRQTHKPQLDSRLHIKVTQRYASPLTHLLCFRWYMANLLQKSWLTVHALLNFRMKAEMYGTVAAVVLVGRLWFDPALRATSHRKMKVATASHPALHSVTTPASPPSPVACPGPNRAASLTRLLWSLDSYLAACLRRLPWTPIPLCGLLPTIIASLIKTCWQRQLFGSLPFACSSCELAAVNN